MSTDQNHQVLRTLRALNVVVRSSRPMTGQELGARLGIHQTSASRLLRSLATAGYCREVSGGYVPDLQVFALGADAVESFPIISQYRSVMTELSLRDPSLDITLATLHNGVPLYFLRTLAGRAMPYSARDYPLNLSVASMRLLLTRSRSEALELLQEEERRGWEQPTATAPAGPLEALELALAQLHRDALVIPGWLHPEHIAGAVPVKLPHPTQFVLAASSTDRPVDAESLITTLLEHRSVIENHRPVSSQGSARRV